MSEIEARIPVAQANGSKALKRLRERIASGSREDHMRAILAFYDTAESRDCPESVFNQTDLEVKAFCFELGYEAINRDFCAFVSTGTRGNVGKIFYTSLKK